MSDTTTDDRLTQAAALLTEGEGLYAQSNQLETQVNALRDQWREKLREAAALMADFYYGVKVGDVIEYSEERFNRKPFTRQLLVQGFNVFNLQSRPIFEGLVLLRDGSPGSRRDSIFPENGKVKWAKVGGSKIIEPGEKVETANE